MSNIPAETYQVVKDLLAPAALTADDVTYSRIVDVMKEHVKPERSALVCRYEFAVKHRVQANDLPDDQPQRPIQEIKNSEFLPSLLDHAALRLQFITITARITTKRLTCLFDFSKLAVSHIKHRHSGSMKQKSELVSCLFTRLVCNELVVR